MNGHRIGAGARERLYASTTVTYDEAADLDYIAIEYALNGEKVRLTQAEKIHAARLLHDRGYSDKAVGERIGCGASTIGDWRANDWKPAPPRKGRVHQAKQVAQAGLERAA